MVTVGILFLEFCRLSLISLIHHIALYVNVHSHNAKIDRAVDKRAGGADYVGGIYKYELVSGR